MSRKTSDILFWAKHLSMALILIIAAAVIINLEGGKSGSSESKVVEKKVNIDDGLSDFYREYRSQADKPQQEDGGNFVMDVKGSESSLNERLKSMESMQKPTSGRWVGEHRNRSFKAGASLREIITEYAQSEGMQVIWELEQDFIIKGHFQMDDTIVGSLNQIARAIDANFENRVLTYFCSKQRSLVITTEKTDYVRENCILNS